jgi:uncharacterized protein YdaT
MPWDEANYPVSMKNLPSAIRRKAIDIANALLREGHAESQAIPIGISKANALITGGAPPGPGGRAAP